MANTAICIDLETLDTLPSATILTIGAVKFDPHGNESVDNQMEPFYVKVDLASCEPYNLTISNETIAWWAKQGTEAHNEAFEGTDRIPIEDAMHQLFLFARGCKTFWSHGAGFDIVICEHLFRQVGRAIPWKYHEIRDTRTIYDLGIDPDFPEIEVKHHALQDAYAEAIAVQNVFRKIDALQAPTEKPIVEPLHFSPSITDNIV
jgi:DNA polymerase III epsilon subunit-like protein